MHKILKSEIEAIQQKAQELAKPIMEQLYQQGDKFDHNVTEFKYDGELKSYLVKNPKREDL